MWYKSNTQGRWINAEVKDVEVEAGQIVYNLNVQLPPADVVVFEGGGP